MKKEFCLKLKIKNCETIFDEELGPGVISEASYVFSIEKYDKNSKIWITKALMDYEKLLIEDSIEVEVSWTAQRNPVPRRNPLRPGDL